MPFLTQTAVFASQVNVGKDQSSGRYFDTAAKFDGAGVIADGDRSVRRTLGVSLLGACSSKGCPTKSVENEDRYAHVSFFLPVFFVGCRTRGKVASQQVFSWC